LADRASALALVLSARQWVPPDKTEPQATLTHAFDAGAGGARLALQVSLAGWVAHGIGGFDRDKARTADAIPAEFDLLAVIAIGRRGDQSLLPDGLQVRATPSPRRPLSALAAVGRFGLG
jgi:hypothetical protein